MEAKLIEDRRQWNEFVATARTGHLCQTWEWADHSEEGARAGSLRIGVVDDDGRLVAAVLLTRSMASWAARAILLRPARPRLRRPHLARAAAADPCGGA